MHVNIYKRLNDKAFWMKLKICRINVDELGFNIEDILKEMHI